MGNWRFIPADLIQVRRWSYGQVKSVEDLYNPKIFGPTRDLRCECGKHAGSEAVGTLCDICGVAVAKDASLLRQTRLGHIDFSCFGVRHPLAADRKIFGFPIAPIAYRLGPEGSASELGMKYEMLVRLCAAADAELLPLVATEECVNKIRNFDGSGLSAAIADIVGARPIESGTGVAPAENSLMALVIKALITIHPGIAALIRSCGIALDINETL